MNCECQNCDWIGHEEELACQLGSTPDLNIRLIPGEIVPAGECPKCGSFVHMLNERGENPAKKKPVNPMTPNEYVAKFPGSHGAKWRVNENVLEDIACPKCGNRKSFNIEVRMIVEVTDEGTDTDGGDSEWEAESHCRCNSCHHSATVADFTIEDLEEHLEELNDTQP